jgi:hypothetical protein
MHCQDTFPRRQKVSKHNWLDNDVYCSSWSPEPVFGKRGVESMIRMEGCTMNYAKWIKNEMYFVCPWENQSHDVHGVEPPFFPKQEELQLAKTSFHGKGTNPSSIMYFTIVYYLFLMLYFSILYCIKSNMMSNTILHVVHYTF